MLLTTATLGILILIVLLIVSSVYLVFNMFIRNFQVIVRVLKCDGYRNRELMAFVMSSMIPHLLIGGLISNITLYFVGVALLK